MPLRSLRRAAIRVGFAGCGRGMQEVATQITAFAQTHLGLTLPELEIDGQVRYCWQHWPAGEVLVVIDDVTGYDKIEALFAAVRSAF